MFVLCGYLPGESFLDTLHSSAVLRPGTLQSNYLRCHGRRQPHFLSCQHSTHIYRLSRWMVFQVQKPVPWDCKSLQSIT